MSGVFSIRVDLAVTERALRAKLALLPKQVVDPAIKSAMYRTVKEAQTAARRAIAEMYNIKAATIAKYLEIGPVTQAAPGRYKTWIQAQTSRPGYRGLRLIHFGAKQTKRGLSVKVLKAGKRSIIKRAFVVQQPNGVDDAVTRTSSTGARLEKAVPRQGRYKGRIIKRGPRKGQYLKRQSLRTLFSVDVAQMFNTKRVNAVIRERLAERYQHNLRRDLAYYTKRYNNAR